MSEFAIKYQDILIFPYRDTLASVGNAYTGKSYLIKFFVAKIPRLVVWDTNDEYRNMPNMAHVDTISQLLATWKRHKRVVFHPRLGDYVEFCAFTNACMQHFRNYTLVLEELQDLQISRKSMEIGAAALFTRGRHLKTGIFASSRRINAGLPRLFTSNLSHMFCFYQYLPVDRDFVGELIGSNEYEVFCSNIASKKYSIHSFMYFHQGNISFHAPLPLRKQ